MSNDKFVKLLEPGYIGKVKLKNRLIKTAQGSSVIEPDTGFAGERAKAYYGTLARGGVGLVIVESCGVEYPTGVHHPGVQFRLHEDSLIPSFTGLAQEIHNGGCAAFIQLIHSGPWNPTGMRNFEARCSSAMTKAELPGPDFLECKGMTVEEVQEVIEMFIHAAERAQKAGFDGVEINASTANLPNSFLSRVFNKREDEYGASSLENRARFVTDIITGIKKRCGAHFPVITLLNIAEYNHDRATPIEEGIQFAKLMQDAGADAIQVRAHLYGYRSPLLHADKFFYPELMENPPKDLDWKHQGRGSIIPLAVAVKTVVTVPVFAACWLDPVLGERLLQEGKIDFVGMTRRLLADPDLPIKVMENRLKDIRPCLGCLYCVESRMHDQPVLCRVNPGLNRETELNFQKAPEAKKVLIIGAGPAGMEAARTAAIRGHRVTLYCMDTKLGGVLPLTALVQDLETKHIMTLIKYYETQLKKLGVYIRVGYEVNTYLVDALKSDAVIFAGGGVSTLPDIPGIQGKNVISGGNLHWQLKKYLKYFWPQELSWLTKVWMPIGKRVIVVGGRIHGCEIAEFLVKRGRQVTIVDHADALGEGMMRDDKAQLFPWFEKKGVKTYLEVKYDEITARGMTVTAKNGETLSLEADTIIIALPLASNNEMMEKLKGKVPELYSIGDSKDPRYIAQAIADGCSIAHKL